MMDERTGPRIVLADDEELNHELVDSALQASLWDYTLVAFAHRDRAWEALCQAAPDLLITDMRSDNIPGRTEYFGMSGIELLRRLAARRVTYPIMVVSGSFSMFGREAKARQVARPHLNVCFLTKPYSLELFQQALRQCLGSGTRCRFKV